MYIFSLYIALVFMPLPSVKYDTTHTLLAEHAVKSLLTATPTQTQANNSTQECFRSLSLKTHTHRPDTKNEDVHTDSKKQR